MKCMNMLLTTMLFMTCSLLFSAATVAQNQHVFVVPPGGGELVEYVYFGGQWNQEIFFQGNNVFPQNSTITSFTGGGK